MILDRVPGALVEGQRNTKLSNRKCSASLKLISDATHSTAVSK